MGTLACSRTAPESRYPPDVGTLPVAPMPDKSGFEDTEPAAPPAPSGEKARGPTPIAGTLPSGYPTALARTHACKDKQCRLDKFLPDPAFAKSTPAGVEAPGTLWLEELAAQSTLIVPRHHRLELLAIVVAGDALASGDDGSIAQKLGTWGTLRAPGAGVTLKAGAGGAKIVIGLAATTGTLSAALASAEKKPFEVRWLKRPSAPSSVALDHAKDLAWGGGAFHARIAFGAEPPIPASLELLHTGPDAEIKQHDHPTWEHIAVLDGAGTMKIAGSDHAVGPGSVFNVPPATQHAFVPAGKKPLIVVQMYTPSGPEQRFVKLAAEEAAAAKAGGAKK